MDGTFPGLGTLINMATVVVGSLAGIAVGNRLHARTRGVVTDSLGLATLLLAALSAVAVTDALGRGIEQLLLKSVLDGFAALAFASTFGVGVLLSALSVGVVQGALTVLGMVLGQFLPEPHIAALTATGGLLLVGIALRLLRVREDLPVAAMLPALVVAPLLTELVLRLS